MRMVPLLSECARLSIYVGASWAVHAGAVGLMPVPQRSETAAQLEAPLHVEIVVTGPAPERVEGAPDGPAQRTLRRVATRKTASVRASPKPQRGDGGPAVGAPQQAPTAGAEGGGDGELAALRTGALGAADGGPGAVVAPPSWTAPVPLPTNQSPVYPRAARRAGVDGRVLAELRIDASGRVLQVEMLEGNDVFEEAVKSVAMHWRYEPASRDGRRVGVTWRVLIPFTLE